MLLIDALYINTGGGKVLLDYLMRELNTTGQPIHYLLDERIRHTHEPVRNGTVQYQKASIAGRFIFYRKNRSRFSTVFCFGNLPPSIRLTANVFTYFHQPLFLAFSKELPLRQKCMLLAKTMYLRILINYTDYWIVQTGMIRNALAAKYKISQPGETILLLPFYRSLASLGSMNIPRKKVFIYISSGEAHKNHPRLLNAFAVLYDEMQTGELHLTVENRFTAVCDQIRQMQEKGYPVINHGMIPHEQLRSLYYGADFLIYPSLAESFGLGIIEAIECGCKVIGADRPYLQAVCIPSATFNPESSESIQAVMKKAMQHDLPPSKQLVFDNIHSLIDIIAGN